VTWRTDSPHSPLYPHTFLPRSSRGNHRSREGWSQKWSPHSSNQRAVGSSRRTPTQACIVVLAPTQNSSRWYPWDEARPHSPSSRDGSSSEDLDTGVEVFTSPNKSGGTKLTSSGTKGHPNRSAQENHLESGCVHKARHHVKSSRANAGPYITGGRLGSDHTLDGPKP
jgi:hypothetical protein